MNKWIAHLQKVKEEEVSAQVTSTVQISFAKGKVVLQANQGAAHRNRDPSLMTTRTSDGNDALTLQNNVPTDVEQQKP